MELLHQKKQLRMDAFGYRKRYPNKKKQRRNRGELCPDCGATLRMEGRCMYCAYCGWSTC